MLIVLTVGIVYAKRQEAYVSTQFSDLALRHSHEALPLAVNFIPPRSLVSFSLQIMLFSEVAIHVDLNSVTMLYVVQ
jgi:hypothetical protein